VEPHNAGDCSPGRTANSRHVGAVTSIVFLCCRGFPGCFAGPLIDEIAADMLNIMPQVLADYQTMAK